MLINPDVISIVLEFLPSLKQVLRLRHVSRAFDSATYRISLVKLHQARAMQAHLTHEVDSYDPD